MKIEYREITTDSWPAFEALFGANGACGGCWCQAWRVAHGGKTWAQTKGEPARQRMKSLIESGKACGILAFEGDTAIGWCSFGPRSDFPRLETMKAYRRKEPVEAWCVNCFFIPRQHRGKGLSRGLLKAAVAAMKRRGIACIEAYPATTTRDGKQLPAAFAWTGPLKIFQELGFKEVQRLSFSRPLLQLTSDK